MSTQCKAVKLTKAERKTLEHFVAQGKKTARAITRARLLLLSDEGRKDRELTELLGVSRATVYTVRKKYQQRGRTHILTLLQEVPRSGRLVKFDSRGAANVTRIACSTPPKGRGRWTLRLIADKVVQLDVTEAISHEGARRLLKKQVEAVAH
jgi:putative transposase